MTFFRPQKPNDVLDYSRDWTEFLDGDTIVLSTWTVTPAATITDSSFAGNVTFCMLSGLSYGQTYELVNRITTLEGTPPRTVELSMTIRCGS